MLTTSSRKREVFRSHDLRHEYAGTLPVYRFEPLNQDPTLVHAVFTRLGGVSLPPYASLNLGHSVGDDLVAVETNHDRVCQALQISRRQVTTCHLTHSDDVLVVTAADRGRVVGQGDAIVTADSGVYLSMRFADCVPILLHDPVRRAAGLAHAGWRGTVKNVAGAAVQTMINQLACLPENITAVIGPAIGCCCYQVGEDVIQAVEATFSPSAPPARPVPPHDPAFRDRDNGRSVGDEGRAKGSGRAQLFSRRNGRYAYLDLWEANRRQLVLAGVGRVVVAGLCTACHNDDFFSHRAEGGRTGRFGVVIGYRE